MIEQPQVCVRLPQLLSVQFDIRLIVMLLLLLTPLLSAGCNGGGGSSSSQRETFVVALESQPETLDPLRATDASSERLRQLMFNTLVRRNEQLTFVGDLATDFQTAPDNLSVTFTLRDNVQFHDGRAFTSTDAKYTFDYLIASDSRKAPSFFVGSGQARQPRIASVDAPDARTLVIRLTAPWNELLQNLVAIPIVPQGSGDAQRERPIGTGPFSFASYDESQQVVDLRAFDKYWEGAPPVKQLRVRVILDVNTLQAELQSGRIDLVPPYGTLSPDAYRALGNSPNLRVEQFPGVNIVYLGFNTQSQPLNNQKVRQAISHAVDREGIIRDLLLGQARLAHSMLPEESWAFAPGQKYSYDPARAKQLLDEAGFRDPDGDGPRMRFDKPLAFKISASNQSTKQFAGVMQNSLKEVGVPVSIDTFELASLLDQLRNGQYQLTSARWVGGNQDPIFLRDLFTFLISSTFNRSRYSNPALDTLLREATTTTNRDRARELYVQAQELISREMPTLPLWYPNNIVIARKGVGNIKVEPNGDWSFLRRVTMEN